MTILITEDLSVYELLQAYPVCIKVLIWYHTHCVGCVLDSFCTLQDVAQHYQLPLEELLAALREASGLQE
jgi:hybrid cluster-associated redox disulfide protein